jgi:hypothetical protein
MHAETFDRQELRRTEDVSAGLSTVD